MTNPERITSMPWIQERIEGEDRVVDGNLERRLPSQKEKEQMDRELIALGNLFKDSDIWWKIDGGLNVSLTKGQYIGVHKDIDVSFQRGDIPKLEELLAKKGYGLFLYQENKSPDGTQEHVLRRVGAKGFQKKGEWRYHIQAIDEGGQARTDDLSWLDVHIIERNELGEPYYEEFENTVIPEHWLDTKTVEFHGVPLRLSRPALFIFFKMYFAREYDEDDIKKYITLGEVNENDITEIEAVINEKVFKILERRKELIQKAAREIANEFHQGHHRDEITKKIVTNVALHELASTFGNKNERSEWLRSRMQQLADLIMDMGNPTYENIVQLMDVHTLKERISDRLVKIRKWMQDRENTQN